jgi:hypothetical protein
MKKEEHKIYPDSEVSRTTKTIQSQFQEVYTDREFTSAVYGSIKRFKKLGLWIGDFEDAMRISLEKTLDAEGTVLYFYGICWRKVEHKQPNTKIIEAQSINP